MAIKFEHWDEPTIANIERALDETMAVAVDAFEQTFSTWQEHHPKLTHERSPMQRTIIVTDDIYFYVNFGTKVRYAVMTDGFYPKTVPGVLSAGSGVGKMAYVGKFPRAGIKARRFDNIIGEIALEDLTARITKVAL